ncbi:conserved hypothetical protein [Mesorhizobium metallidurans STM 2683]|uniref:Uncharacterized protein n=1 Tax=Mesorhizobium metallidurans STM 2683 TaxID=1297569 RepID=M5F9K0_9HYPH|nr:conserved hypothetical protein [Mesorhizobium metallidurans STM 2683]
MRSSQMEKYVLASVLYYTVATVGFMLTISIGMLGALWGLLALFGYLELVISLNIWRRKRHPRSVHQIELAKQRLDN